MSYDPTKPYKQRLLELVESTWVSPFVRVRPGLYPMFERKFQGLEIDHTDGLGTKGRYHWVKGSFSAAVQDALAMNLNDLAMARAQAYKLQDHLVLPSDNHQAIIEIITDLARECRRRQIVMTGGETSIHTDGTFDLSLTVSGRVLSDQPNRILAGDVLFGLPSQGIHSNGFTKVREIFGDETRAEFTAPTQIYSDLILSLLKTRNIHGLMHITGGAFTKLRDIAADVDIHISRHHQLEPQPIFFEMYKHGLADFELYRTFNCGIGFIFSVPSDEVSRMEQTAGVIQIGAAITGTGRVLIESKFSSQEVTL